jgi:hypothetical protein
MREIGLVFVPLSVGIGAEGERMIYLVLTWMIAWCLVRVIKTEPGVTIVAIVAAILGLLIVFGLPDRA